MHGKRALLRSAAPGLVVLARLCVSASVCLVTPSLPPFPRPVVALVPCSPGVHFPAPRIAGLVRASLGPHGLWLTKDGSRAQGFENYLKKQNPTTSGHRAQKRKFKDEERLFSRSSVTAPNSTWSLEAEADNTAPSKKGRKSGGRKSRGSRSHKRKGNDYVYSSDSEYEGY